MLTSMRSKITIALNENKCVISLTTASFLIHNQKLTILSKTVTDIVTVTFHNAMKIIDCKNLKFLSEKL